MSGKAMACLILSGAILLTTTLSSAEGLSAIVKDHLGSPTLFVNGEPAVPMMFLGRTFSMEGKDWRENYMAQAKLAAAAGIHIQSFDVGMPWPKPGEEADFSGVDAILDAMVANDPEVLMLPRFGVLPPSWWYEEHPGHQMLFSDGQKGQFSVASETWRNDMERHLRAFVRHCEAKYGANMLGYHPCGQHTAEWFYDRSWEPVHNGFEEAFRSGFAAWARRKYGAEDALSAAWGQPEVTFDSVRVPNAAERDAARTGFFRDPSQERFVIDFHEYQNVAMVEALELMARAIKEETNGKKLVVLFYGYFFDLGGIPKGPQSSGHMALGRLLKCPDVDVLTAPISYGDRELGGSGPFMTLVDSVRDAGKLWLNEDDTRTFLCSPTSAMVPVGKVDTVQESQWLHQRNFAQLLPRRLACWYMDLPGEGWLNAPELWDNIGRLRTLYAAEMARPADWNPEIALVADERSTFYLADSPTLTALLGSGLRRACYRMGAPFRQNLLSDVLEGRLELPRLTIFTCCIKLTAKERGQIKKALDGKTAVWLYGSGYLDDARGSIENMTDLTGFSFAETRDGGPAVVAFEHDQPLAQGLRKPTYGPELALTPRWSVKEEHGVETLARFSDGSVAAAVAEGGRFRSIYIGTVECPTQVLRNIARTAGVHVYLDSDDVVLTDGRFLAVSASSSGEKAIALPKDCSLRRMDADERLDATDGLVRETLALGETRFYWIEP